MPPERPQMHNCKKSGSMNRKESTIGKTKINVPKINNMPIKLLPSPKWDKSWKMKLLWERNKWWKKCNNTTRCLPKKREIESPNGSLINNLRMHPKLKEQIWVTLCKRISPPPNPNLLHTDLSHITSRVSEKNKSKILWTKETNKSLMLSNHRKITTPRNMHGLFKIYLIPNINSITNLTFKIDRNKLWLSTVMPTYRREKPRMPDGQTCMVIWTHFQMFKEIWLLDPTWDQLSEEFNIER